MITAVKGGVTVDPDSNNVYEEERSEYFTEAATDTSDLVNFESLALFILNASISLIMVFLLKFDVGHACIHELSSISLTV